MSTATNFIKHVPFKSNVYWTIEWNPNAGLNTIINPKLNSNISNWDITSNARMVCTKIIPSRYPWDFGFCTRSEAQGNFVFNHPMKFTGLDTPFSRVYFNASSVTVRL